MQGQQIFLPQLSKINKILIISSIVSLVISTLAPALSLYFGLSAGRFLAGHVYTLFTYSFISNSLSLVLFNGLLLWFMGSEIEQLWGTSRYLFFFFCSVLGAGLIYLLVSFFFFKGAGVYHYPLMGTQGFCSTILLAYAILFPNRILSIMMIFPVKAKWVCLIAIFVQLYYGLSSPRGALAWGHLGAMLCGFVFMLVVSSGWWTDKKTIIRKRRKRVEDSHLSIVKNEKKDDEKPKVWH